MYAEEITTLREKSYVMVSISNIQGMRGALSRELPKSEIDNIVYTIHKDHVIFADVSKKLPKSIKQIFSKAS